MTQFVLPEGKVDFWGSTDPAFECLVDHKRCSIFQRAIGEYVGSEDIVIDAGAGTGILSLFAARKAKKVYAIEKDSHLCYFLNETIKRRGIDNIEVINDDILNVTFPREITVIIAEMISTGLIDELQLPAVEHLKRFTVPDARFIPLSVANYLDLVDANTTFFREDMFLIRYEYSEFPKTRASAASQKKLINVIDFSKDQHTRQQTFDDHILVTRNGSINGIRISTTTIFDDQLQLGGTYAFCMPLILPLPTMHVRKGQKIKATLKYEISGGLSNLSYSVS